MTKVTSDRAVPISRTRPTNPSAGAAFRFYGTPPVMSRYHAFMTKQTTVRLPDDLADQAETVARVHGTSVNQLIIDSLATEIDRVRADNDFMTRARRLLERDQQIIDRLAK